MSDVSVWRLEGTENQQRLVTETLARTTFPFDVLLPGLQSQTGRTHIPVDWSDLSRYAAALEVKAATGGHLHVHEDGDTGHPITRSVDGRERVLGLAWYSGRVSLDLGLENDPELAAEVFLSEGAHMIDFFWFTDEHRVAVWNALHAGTDQDVPPGTDVVDGIPLGHEHGWFDVGGYYAWVGEAWMGLFVRAYSDVPVTIDFDHPPTDVAVIESRNALTPYFQSPSGTVHDQHRKAKIARYLMAIPEGAKRCGICRPV